MVNLQVDNLDGWRIEDVAERNKMTVAEVISLLVEFIDEMKKEYGLN